MSRKTTKGKKQPRPSGRTLTPSKLKRNRFFKDFSEKELSELLEVCTVQTFDPEEYVLREKDVSRHICIILAGRIQVGKVLYAGDEKELGTLGPGEFFGEMAFLDGSPRSASASSVEHSTVIMIDKDSFDKLVSKRPAIAYKITMKIARVLAARLRESNNLIEGIFSNPNKTILELKTRLMKIQAMLLKK